MKRSLIDLGFGFLGVVLALWLWMQYWDHQHLKNLCAYAVPPGFCDHGPVPTK